MTHALAERGDFFGDRSWRAQWIVTYLHDSHVLNLKGRSCRIRSQAGRRGWQGLENLVALMRAGPDGATRNRCSGLIDNG
jgi:hypothetical protein